MTQKESRTRRNAVVTDNLTKPVMKSVGSSPRIGRRNAQESCLLVAYLTRRHR